MIVGYRTVLRQWIVGEWRKWKRKQTFVILKYVLKCLVSIIILKKWVEIFKILRANMGGGGGGGVQTNLVKIKKILTPSKGSVKTKLKQLAFGPNLAGPPPHPLPPSWHSEFWIFLTHFFILMDTKHFKMDFSMKGKNIFFFTFFILLLFTVSKLYYTYYYLRLLMMVCISTNMVCFDCFPGTQQPRCYIHCL